MRNQPVLDVEQLKTYFYLNQNQVAKAVDDFIFSFSRGDSCYCWRIG